MGYFWKDLWGACADLFVNYLFAPLDYLRSLELDNWWLANIVSWTFVVVGMIAFVYWMKQLAVYNANGEEDKSITSHSYL